MVFIKSKGQMLIVWRYDFALNLEGNNSVCQEALWNEGEIRKRYSRSQEITNSKMNSQIGRR